MYSWYMLDSGNVYLCKLPFLAVMLFLCINMKIRVALGCIFATTLVLQICNSVLAAIL